MDCGVKIILSNRKNRLAAASVCVGRLRDVFRTFLELDWAQMKRGLETIPFSAQYLRDPL